jgi:phage shock protein PspC (stress-responsive transcriptional regulator)
MGVGMQPPPGNQTFYRGSDRIIGGVCSGLAEGFHVETLWVRLAFVVLAFLQGAGVLLYVVLWVLMPERAGQRPVAQTAFDSMGNDVKRAWADLRAQFGSVRPATPPASQSTAAPTPPSSSPQSSASGETAQPPPGAPVGTPPASRNSSFILGAILVVVGVAFLIANTGLLNWSVIWPAMLVALGVALLVRNLQTKSGE